MRKIIILFSLILGIFSCKNEPKDYMTLSGTITNHLSDTLYITDGRRTYNKTIKINQDGYFNDTLKVKTGDYRFSYGDEYGIIYLKNNNVSSLDFDYKDFHNSLVYGGDDADINNFAIENYRLINKHLAPDMAYDATKEDIDSAKQNLKTDYEKLKSNFENLDSLHIANNNVIINKAIQTAEIIYSSNMDLLNALPKGSPSPIFENYENYDGGTNSLFDFKGKYVYITFWASWHSASKKYLILIDPLEAKFKDKNIVFINISLDDIKTSGTIEKAKENWKKSINNNDIGGLNLFADKGWVSDFVVKYQIKGIPRFILIDPDGNIISPNAPSPSNPKFNELFDSLDL